MQFLIIYFMFGAILIAEYFCIFTNIGTENNACSLYISLSKNLSRYLFENSAFRYYLNNI